MYDIFYNYLNKMDMLLTRMKMSKIKVITQKFVFYINQIEYFDFYITYDGIKSIDKYV